MATRDYKNTIDLQQVTKYLKLFCNFCYILLGRLEYISYICNTQTN